MENTSRLRSITVKNVLGKSPGEIYEKEIIKKDKNSIHIINFMGMVTGFRTRDVTQPTGEVTKMFILGGAFEAINILENKHFSANEAVLPNHFTEQLLSTLGIDENETISFAISLTMSKTKNKTGDNTYTYLIDDLLLPENPLGSMKEKLGNRFDPTLKQIESKK